MHYPASAKDKETRVADVGRVQLAVGVTQDGYAGRRGPNNGPLGLLHLQEARFKQLGGLVLGKVPCLDQPLTRPHEIQGKEAGVHPISPPTPDPVGHPNDVRRVI